MPLILLSDARQVITSAERDEARSHGLFRLPGFCHAVRSGRVPGDAQPVVHDKVRLCTYKAFAVAVGCDLF